ncbi:BgtA-20104 [Blumeria graminis f. sp. tritici]|uniref:BgtA-20104 n=2 Tax=Blumeria graminis f. sp. tritici TaxID=62690 RepID=A0A9X9MES7_BLUGR|nr:hypothetical protein BGT96224_A20104 [Blumeria graminis f. sp. tritici 96224]VDB83736.1 BgtA-20104 [Blumeria graminis f. sp. tritici]
MTWNCLPKRKLEPQKETLHIPSDIAPGLNTPLSLRNTMIRDCSRHMQFKNSSPSVRPYHKCLCDNKPAKFNDAKTKVINHFWGKSQNLEGGAQDRLQYQLSKHPIDSPLLSTNKFERVEVPKINYVKRQKKDVLSLSEEKTMAGIKRNLRNHLKLDYKATSSFWLKRARKSKRSLLVPRHKSVVAKVGGVFLLADITDGISVTNSSNPIRIMPGSRRQYFQNVGIFDRYAGSKSEREPRLYFWCKKSIRTRLIPNNQVNPDSISVTSKECEHQLISRTTFLLEETSKYFKRSKKSQKSKNGTNLTINTPKTISSYASFDSSPRPFGFAPWHRTESYESLWSLSSSVHRLLIGKTPPATPVLENKYVGSDGKMYSMVDISSTDPLEASFLPSEATRIRTPTEPLISPVLLLLYNKDEKKILEWSTLQCTSTSPETVAAMQEASNELPGSLMSDADTTKYLAPVKVFIGISTVS